MDTLLSTITQYAGILKAKAFSIVDAVFPPEKRAELLAKLQSFAINNPKLSFFLLTNVALTGIPLGLFALFTLTVFVFALIVSLILALLVTVLFTVFMVGVALIIVLPTIFLTTMAASFFTLWGLGGYYLLRWFNEGETPAAPGKTLGDTLSSITGGRLDGIMDSARGQFNAQKTGIGAVPGGSGGSGASKGSEGKGSQENESGQTANGNAATDAAGKTTGAATNSGQGVQKTSAGSTKKATDTAGTTTGTAKGTAAGATA